MRLFTLLVCTLLSTLPTVSRADVITTNFSGVLTGQFGPIPSLLSSFYTIGESFSGRYSYESSLPAYVLQADTNYYDGFSELTITIGSDTWSAPVAWAEVSNNTLMGGKPVDVFGVNAGVSPNSLYDLTGPTVGGFKLVAPQLQFLDNSGSVFLTKALPSAPLNFLQFSTGYATLLFASPTSGYVAMWGQINSLSGSVTPVPEPETYAMLLAGLGLLGVLARRRKQIELAVA